MTTIQVSLPGESPWTEESGGLQSIGSQRVGHNWSELTCTILTQKTTPLSTYPEIAFALYLHYTFERTGLSFKKWELDYKEGWALKNWCFWAVVLEKTLESPLDCKEIQPVNPKGNQSWIFMGRTDAETETPVLWPSDVKNWLTEKDPDAEKDWRQEEKGMTEDRMTGWYHQLNGHEFEQALGDGEGQGSLVCCSPWGCKE